MAISVIGATAVAPTNKIMFTTTNATVSELTKTLDPGYYMVTIYPPSGTGGTVTATLKFTASNGTVYNVTTYETDSGSTRDPSMAWVNLPTGATKVSVSATALTAIIEKISEPLVLRTGTLTSYRTSQSITVSSSADCILWGGGGGGGGAANQGNGGAGGGGGGGFTTFSIAAGSYSLVAGGGGAGQAGATNGSDGGTSTFAGYTCTGGQGGRHPNAGNGGGVGGSPNGANGGGGGAAGSSPSASLFPSWLTPGVGGAAGTGGNPGGGGGGCVGNGGNGGSGGSGNNGVDGGGGGGAFNLGFSTGGTGAGGGVGVMVWS